VPDLEIINDGRPVIAIVGGGASGTLAAVHLLRLAADAPPLRILLIDRHGRHGRGRAYATTHPAHLLNSPAQSMSAVAGDPGHLTRWAATAGISHDGFLTRRDYGRYLRDLLSYWQKRAHPHAVIGRISADVSAIAESPPRRRLRLRLAPGGPVDADLVVLATGSLQPAASRPVPHSDRYIADPWAPGALDGAADGSPVIVTGTGLTMLDVAMTVTGAHPGTVVHAVSRHGLLPREHRPVRQVARVGTVPPAPGPIQPGEPVRLAGLVRQVRAAAGRHPGGWQDAVDALRPQVPALWQALPDADRRLFLRRYARYWEIHRHRMPPATARRIAELRAAGRLRIWQGQVIAAWDEPDGVRARLAGGRSVTDLTAGWLVNGTGPAADIGRVTDPLLRGLLDDGLARPDSLRLGLDADSGGAVIDASGQPSDRIFTLGPLLRGSRYETTAIAEIRDQAAALARRLADASSPAARRGSAA
jgi:uncharacterized NAD(P)/FAD-binding protein YdhS